MEEKRGIADKGEILKNVTEIMRDATENSKPADKIRAAEFLAKHDDEFEDEDTAGVIIIDDIPDTELPGGG